MSALFDWLGEYAPLGIMLTIWLVVAPFRVVVMLVLPYWARRNTTASILCMNSLLSRTDYEVGPHTSRCPRRMLVNKHPTNDVSQPKVGDRW
jgi:hypothetical protein